MFKRPLRGSIFALFAIAGGGLIIHLRIHPPGADVFNWVAVGFGLATTFAVPIMFNFRATTPWAYLINVASVVVGIATMTFYSVTHWQGPVTLWTLIAHSTFPDILILLAKLPLGHHILRYHFPTHTEAQPESRP